MCRIAENVLKNCSIFSKLHEKKMCLLLIAHLPCSWSAAGTAGFCSNYNSATNWANWPVQCLNWTPGYLSRLNQKHGPGLPTPGLWSNIFWMFMHFKKSLERTFSTSFYKQSGGGMPPWPPLLLQPFPPQQKDYLEERQLLKENMESGENA